MEHRGFWIPVALALAAALGCTEEDGQPATPPVSAPIVTIISSSPSEIEVGQPLFLTWASSVTGYHELALFSEGGTEKRVVSRGRVDKDAPLEQEMGGHYLQPGINLVRVAVMDEYLQVGVSVLTIEADPEPPDPEPPIITILYPPEGSAVAPGSTVMVDLSAEDPSGVVSLGMEVSGGVEASLSLDREMEINATASFFFAVPGDVEDGAKVQVVGTAVDASSLSNAGESAPLTLVVDGSLQALELVPSLVEASPGETVSFDVVGGQGEVELFLLDGGGDSILDTGEASLEVDGEVGAIIVVGARDGRGGYAEVEIPIIATLSLEPSIATVTPLGSLDLQAVGGTPPYTYFMLDAPSGGDVDPQSGHYVAGPGGGAADIVSVRDAVSRTAIATVNTTQAIMIIPSSAEVLPHRSEGGQSELDFQAQGGSREYTFSLAEAPSGGTISPEGHYQAGSVGGVTDRVIVEDTLGAQAIATVRVGAYPRAQIAVLPGKTTIWHKERVMVWMGVESDMGAVKEIYITRYRGESEVIRDIRLSAFSWSGIYRFTVPDDAVEGEQFIIDIYAKDSDELMTLQSPTVTLTVKERPGPTGLIVAPDTLKVPPGWQEALRVTAPFEDGYDRDVSGHTGGVTYISTNSGVAEVSQEGIITAVGEGTAEITARIFREGDGEMFTASAEVTVVGEAYEVMPSAVALGLTGTCDILVHQLLSGGERLDRTHDGEIAMESSDPAVVSVPSAGRLRAEGRGEAEVWVRAEGVRVATIRVLVDSDLVVPTGETLYLSGSQSFDSVVISQASSLVGWEYAPVDMTVAGKVMVEVGGRLAVEGRSAPPALSGEASFISGWGGDGGPGGAGGGAGGLDPVLGANLGGKGSASGDASGSRPGGNGGGSGGGEGARISNDDDKGGGGGGGGSGGKGGSGGGYFPGAGGSSVGAASGGSGGGGGSARQGEIDVDGGGGGGGGGILRISAAEVQNEGLISAQGGHGGSVLHGLGICGAGGGGAGGLVSITTAEGGRAHGSGILDARGGRGGNSLDDDPTFVGSGGGGGGGGEVNITSESPGPFLKSLVLGGKGGQANSILNPSQAGGDGVVPPFVVSVE